MDRPKQTINSLKCDRIVRLKAKNHKFAILHHNLQSLFNKQMELMVILNTSLHNINALCFTEHWLLEDQLILLEINNFKLVSKFCGNEYKWRILYLCKKRIKY
jgi:hypothetical protein